MPGDLPFELWLMRHAKARSDGPWAHGDDHERPLAPRGERAAALIAATIAQWDAAPEAVLCSSAQRTRETLAAMEALLGRRPTRVEEGLYLAPAARIVDTVRSAAREWEATKVMVIAHNPGISDLAIGLTDPRDPESRADLDSLERGMPTAALCRLGFEIGSWDELRPASGRILRSVVPKQLV